MVLKPILAFAHTLLEGALGPGDIAIDCTMGNGNDTLFLAKLVGEGGHVFAFDIQAAAIENTRKRLEQNGISAAGVTLIRANHGALAEQIPAAALAKCKAAIFNLGYLPGSDKQICTMADTTTAAIEVLLAAIAPGGLIVLVVYPGHPHGELEASELIGYCQAIAHQAANVIIYRILNNSNQPPFVIALERRDN